MARKLNISADEDKAELLATLHKAVQSANLNFILGSGCSVPAIAALGNIERDVQTLLDEKKNEEADRLLFEYLRPFVSSVSILRSTLDKDHKDTLKNYTDFLSVVSDILFQRKNNIIPKQASVFSTNYDLFLEKASEGFLGDLRLNDGFNRNPSLDGCFNFSSTEFFNSIYNNGNLYRYQVQVPSVNLIKMHGSLSWVAKGEDIIFKVDHLTAIKTEMDGVPNRTSRIRGVQST